MTFDEMLAQVQDLLQREQRISYRGLKRRFALDDEYLEDLKEELIGAKRLAIDEDGRFLVWIGDGSLASSVQSPVAERVQSPSSTVQSQKTQPPTPNPQPPSGERRQLTVMFIDLVGSTTLSQQLDPEDYHARVVAYQAACQQIIARYEGHVAQYLGDGVLTYFGYPAAHEDDAVRAMRSGLEIVTAVSQLAYKPPLQVRIGIHTGPVVVGEIGSGERTERLALGETPNIAARVQGTANPDDVVISAATYHLVEGLFACEDRGQPELKGVAMPLMLYRVVRESEAHSRFEVAVQAGLTPLVGRDLELGLLQERWAQAQDGAGQVVLLSGEPGIGKSRLVQELKNVVTQAGAVRIEYRCSAYHQNSALYPLVEHVQRVLHFTPGDTPQDKLKKLEQTLSRYRFPQNDTVPLLATLLSLPQAEGSPPLSLTPQQQKQKTLDVLVRWLFEEAERAPVYTVWEDLHWADPSTLEFLMVCLDQTPTASMLMVLTFRPEFTPAWASRSHISHLVLSRLGQQQSSAIVEGITGGKTLPQEVVQQIASKTDGVPLFVEELTKMVVESGLVKEVEGRYELDGPLPPLAIPSTLQDSLMARLDRLASVRDIAQMCATIGREFTYELLTAVSPLNEDTLQRGLKQLVEAELVYQSGLPPQARYLFKHALVQDTAYQSLLKSRRQQLHQQVARVLEEQFPQTVESQPELVAHHYTEASLAEHAIPYWQRAGQRAIQRSANEEAVTHLTTGLELLKTLPDTPERPLQEMTLQTALGSALLVTKGLGAHEVRETYDRSRQLCLQLGDTPQLFPTLIGLAGYYLQQEEVPVMIELVQQCLSLAERQQDTGGILAAHGYLCSGWFFHGHPAQAHEHCEQTMALYDFERHHSLAFGYGLDSGVIALAIGAWALWYLGYPDQALKRCQDAIALARRVGHPYTLAWALNAASWLHWYRQEGQAAYALADEAIMLANEQEFPHWRAMGFQMRGNALARLGQWEEGMKQLRWGVEAYQATGALVGRDWELTELARGCLHQGQYEEGLHLVREALDLTREEAKGTRHYEPEKYHAKGELLLAQTESTRSLIGKEPQANLAPEAEACFLKTIEIALSQKAKSWELRAATSLARLWQQQGKRAEAHTLLSEIYGWFTEGFDTKDLQEAKALLDELS